MIMGACADIVGCVVVVEVECADMIEIGNVEVSECRFNESALLYILRVFMSLTLFAT